MRLKTVVLLSVAVGLAASLSGCDTLRREAGITKQAPDEFAVVTKAPLIIPPNFNLRPPAPGAPPLNQEDATDSAQALFNGSDPATVAAGMPGNMSMGERMLLANAKAQNSDPAIRAELAADARNSAAAADQSFTDRVLNGSLSPSQVPKKPAPTSSGGWFDWLF